MYLYMFETKKQSLRNTNMHHAVVFNYSTLNQVGKRLVSPVCHYYTKYRRYKCSHSEPTEKLIGFAGWMDKIRHFASQIMPNNFRTGWNVWKFKAERFCKSYSAFIKPTPLKTVANTSNSDVHAKPLKKKSLKICLSGWPTLQHFCMLCEPWISIPLRHNSKMRYVGKFHKPGYLKPLWRSRESNHMRKCYTIRKFPFCETWCPWYDFATHVYQRPAFHIMWIVIISIRWHLIFRKYCITIRHCITIGQTQMLRIGDDPTFTRELCTPLIYRELKPYSSSAKLSVLHHRSFSHH